MFGHKMNQPDGENSEWTLDASTKRMINSKYFSTNMNFLYDKGTRPFGLRPDLTNSEQSTFHKKLRIANDFRSLMLAQLHSETLRWRFYHSFTDLDTLRVARANTGSDEAVRPACWLEDHHVGSDA